VALPCDKDVSVKTIKNIVTTLGIDPEDLESALGRSPRTAAGVVDLRGVDGRIARAIVDKAMSLEWNYPSRDQFLRDVAEGLSNKVSQWSQGQVLQNKDADDRFQDIRVLVRAAHPQVRARGAFRAGPHAEVILNLNKLLPLEVQSPGQMYRYALNTVAHELRHAADWAYNPKGFVDENPNKDPNLSKNDPDAYVNTPTELKSWAGSVADVLIDRVPNVLELDGPNLEQRTRAYAGNVLRLVREENKADFLRRVVKALEMRMKERKRIASFNFRVANKKLKGLERMLGKPLLQSSKDMLKQADPDGKKGYLNLAVRIARIAAGDPNNPDFEAADQAFASAAFEAVKHFDPYRKYAPTKDLGEINDLDELKQVAQEAKRQYYAEPRVENAKFTVLDDSVIRLDSKAAAALICGGDTPWCFGKWNQNFYETYTDNGKLYIVFPDGPDTTKKIGKRRVPYARNRFAVHVVGGDTIGEIKDADNDSVDEVEEEEIAKVLGEVLGVDLQAGGDWQDYNLNGREWIAAGFDDPEDALEWDNHGFSAAEAGDYWDNGWRDPELAHSWNQIGFGARAAKMLHDEGIDPDDAAVLDLETLTEEELSSFIKDDWPFIKSLVEEVVDDLRIADVAKAHQDLKQSDPNYSDGSPTYKVIAVANVVEDLGKSPDEVAAMVRALRPQEGLLSMNEVFNLAMSGLDAAQIEEWVDSDLEVEYAESGLTVDQWQQYAVPRIDSGESADDVVSDFSAWTSKDISPEDIDSWKRARFTPSSASKWAPYFRAEEAQRWRDAGWQPARAWRQNNMGGRPDEEAQWNDTVEALAKASGRPYKEVEELGKVIEQNRQSPTAVAGLLIELDDIEAVKDIVGDFDEAGINRLLRYKDVGLRELAERAKDLGQRAGKPPSEVVGFAWSDVDPDVVARYLKAAPPELFKGQHESTFPAHVKNREVETVASNWERWRNFRDHGLNVRDFPEGMPLEEAARWHRLNVGREVMDAYSIDDAEAVAQHFQAPAAQILQNHIVDYRAAPDLSTFIQRVQQSRHGSIHVERRYPELLDTAAGNIIQALSDANPRGDLDRVASMVARQVRTAGYDLQNKDEAALVLRYAMKHIAIPRSPMSPQDVQKWMSDQDTVTFISPYRQVDPETNQKMSLRKNKRRMQQLLRDIHEMGVKQSDIRFLRGRYTEEETGKEVAEGAVMVRGLSFAQAQDLRKKYGQDSIIFKSEDGATAMYGEDWVEASPSPGGQGVQTSTGDDLTSGSRSHTFNLDFRFGPESPAVDWTPEKGPLTREQIEEAPPASAKAAARRTASRAQRLAAAAAVRWWRQVRVGRASSIVKPFAWTVAEFGQRWAQFYSDPEPDPLAYDDAPDPQVPDDLVGDDPGAEEAPAPAGQEVRAPERDAPDLHKAGADNIRAILDLATPEEVDYWANWYDVAHEEASELADNLGMPLDVVAGVIAALSPNLRWEINIDAAENLLLNPEYYREQIANREEEASELKQRREEILAPIRAEMDTAIAEIRDQRTEELNELKAQLGVEKTSDLPKRRRDAIMNRASKSMEKVRKRYRPQLEDAAAEVNAEIAKVNAKYPFRGIPSYSSNIKKALRIIDTGNPNAGVSGPKVTVFYESMVDPQGTRRDIVLDGHAINIYRGEYNAPVTNMASLSLSERQQVEAAYNQVAREYGLQPQEVQAITWSVWRQVKPKPSQARKAKRKTAARVVHYSRQPGLTTLDPKMVGSNALSRRESQDTRVPVTFFYLEGTEPEQMVVQRSKARYEAEIPDNLLDLGQGAPQEVKEGFKQDGRGGMYQAMKDLGYFGFYNSKSALPNAVAVFYPVDVTETPFGKDNPHATDYQRVALVNPRRASEEMSPERMEEIIVGPFIEAEI